MEIQRNPPPSDDSIPPSLPPLNSRLDSSLDCGLRPGRSPITEVFLEVKVIRITVNRVDCKRTLKYLAVASKRHMVEVNPLITVEPLLADGEDELDQSLRLEWEECYKAEDIQNFLSPTSLGRLGVMLGALAKLSFPVRPVFALLATSPVPISSKVTPVGLSSRYNVRVSCRLCIQLFAGERCNMYGSRRANSAYQKPLD